ncbi:MAG: hypothetical protein ACI9T8_000268 [Candidatus Saccharimonadales bacterium]|jgi:hypothetical protein
MIIFWTAALLVIAGLTSHIGEKYGSDSKRAKTAFALLIIWFLVGLFLLFAGPLDNGCTEIGGGVVCS